MYVWLHMAIYTHMYSIYTPKWCDEMTSSVFTAQEANVCYTKLIASYDVITLNFYTEGCSTSPANFSTW